MSAGRFAILLLFPLGAKALTIQIDYRYDTQQFFGTETTPNVAARAALEAAAARYEEIIDQDLDAVNLADDSLDRRIQFVHPGTGELVDVSSAVSAGSDALVLAGAAPAAEYRGPWSLPADTIVIYAGGNAMTAEAAASTGGGLNFTTVFDDPGSHLNRSFNSGIYSMPMWGGSLAFGTSGATWHLDPDTAAPPGRLDLYSYALHEIGHLLGVATAWDDMAAHLTGAGFAGAAAVANYNRDNGTGLAVIEVVDPAYDPAFGVTGDFHFQNAAYQSTIYPGGRPRYAGTVGPDTLQDLLMDRFLGFTGTIRRFELTNTDVGALADLGWNVVFPPPVAPVPITNVQRAPDGSVTITWASEAGRDYEVSTSIDGRTWSKVTPAIPGEGSTTDWIDGESGFTDPNPPAASLPAKIYRVRAVK